MYACISIDRFVEKIENETLDPSLSPHFILQMAVLLSAPLRTPDTGDWWT